MQEPQVAVEHVAVEQREVIQLPRTAVDARRRPVPRRIGVRDPLRERQAGRVRRRVRRRLLRDESRYRGAETENGNGETLLHRFLTWSRPSETSSAGCENG